MPKELVKIEIFNCLLKCGRVTNENLLPKRLTCTTLHIRRQSSTARRMCVLEDLSANQDNLFVYWAVTFITAFTTAVNWTSPQKQVSAPHMSKQYIFKIHFIYFASSDLIL